MRFPGTLKNCSFLQHFSNDTESDNYIDYRQPFFCYIHARCRLIIIVNYSNRNDSINIVIDLIKVLGPVV